jgi:hypothetical protein
MGRSGSGSLRDAIAITAGKIRNAPALVEHQADAGKCHARGEPLDGTRPEVAVMQAKGGGHLWIHGGECHEAYGLRRIALIDDIMKGAGWAGLQREATGR